MLANNRLKAEMSWVLKRWATDNSRRPAPGDDGEDNGGLYPDIQNVPMQTRTTLALVLVLVSATTWAECQQAPGVRLFFDRLSGGWQGEAVTTPVGPRPYDISFERREPFWIYGQADPGAAIHHWGFYCADGELRMRFLSTFRGNREPVLLEAIRITDAKIHFKAQSPAFLEVKVRPGYTHSVFEILHHGERHVLIELKR